MTAGARRWWHPLRRQLLDAHAGVAARHSRVTDRALAVRARGAVALCVGLVVAGDQAATPQGAKPAAAKKAPAKKAAPAKKEGKK